MLIALLSSLSFLFGCGLRSVFVLPSIPLFFAFFCFSLALRFKWFWLFCAFLFGLWRVEAFEAQAPVNPELGFLEFEGQVAEEVDRRFDEQRLVLETSYGRVYMKWNAFEKIQYGDLLQVRGVLERPAEDIDGFKYAKYLAQKRIWLVLKATDLRVLGRAPPNFKSRLLVLKLQSENRVQSLFLEPEAGFVSGLLFGTKQGMSEELSLAFQRIGLTHVIAISGYNISLVIAFVFLLLQKLPFKMKLWCSAFAVIFFVLLVGASAAVARAGIMGVLTVFGLYSGRKSQVYFALLWSAVGMVAWSPYALVYDIGFQLSFAATFGVLLFGPILQSYLPSRLPQLIKEALALSLSAQLVTFPFMAFYFERVSLISPVANLMVAPFIPLAMLFSGLALIFSEPLVLVASQCLKIIEALAVFLSSWIWADFALVFSVKVFFGSIVVLFLWVLLFYRSKWGPALFRGLARASSIRGDP
jgi:ComEC/Rec2-related protein